MSGRHDPRLVKLVAGFLADEFGDDGFLPLSRRYGAAVRLLDLIDAESRPMLVAAPTLTGDEAAELHRAWLEAQADSPGGLIVLPPNASDLWRRCTPEQRRAYLDGHRAEAAAAGIPEDLVDLMIRDAGHGDAYPEDEITGYPDHVIVNGDHSGCCCGGDAP